MIKCIIWDLDNTLWEGVLSEGEVKLCEEYISLIKKLNSLGIINSISSRNDSDIVLDFLTRLSIKELFILPKINWNKKSSNIKELSKELSIKTKDMVFIDDNPFEREEVKSSIGDITVIDPSLKEEILNLQCIKSEKQSEEGLLRYKMYKTEERRIEIRKKENMTNIDFLKQCDIKLSIRKGTENDLERAIELFDRTSQLNTTGIKYSEAELREYLTNFRYNFYIGETRDKYGSYGISSIIIYVENSDSLVLKHLVVSCRLMGKGITDALLIFLRDEALKKEEKNIKIKFIRTKYNRQMLFFLNKNYFEKIEKDFYLLRKENLKKLKKVEWITMEV